VTGGCRIGADLEPAPHSYRGCMSGLAGESGFYLRTLGAKLPPKASWTVGARGKGAAGPVFLHVGTASVEPTEGNTYEPTEGCTTDPYPSFARARVYLSE